MNRPLAPPLLTALATLALGGCATMEPRYDRPSEAVPAALPTGAAYPPAGAAQPWSEIGWRDFFTDPRLKQVISAALDNNRDVRIAIARIESARAQYRIQRSSLMPQIAGQAGATFGETSASTGSAPGVASVHVSQENYALSVGTTSYELDLWGRVRSLNKEALERYLATEETRRATQISLISETATAWLTLAADRSNLSVARETLKSAEASLRLTQRRVEIGVTSDLDVQQAQTLAQQARAQIAQSTTAVAQDENALGLLVGEPVASALLPAMLDDGVTNRDELPAELASSVLLARPDVLAAEHELRAANFDIGAARAAFFPTISLTGSGGLGSNQLSNLFSGGSTNWSVGPSISLPFLDSGRRRAQLDQAKAEKTVQVATYEKAVQTAFREVADALARRGTIGEQVAANEALVAAAARSFQISTRRYDAGVDSYLVTLDAQRTLFNAQQTLVTARLIRATNLVTLYQTLGGGLQ